MAPSGRTMFVLAGAALSAGWLSAGCANFATLQEADVMNRGERRAGAAMTYTSYSVRNYDDTIGTVATPELIFFFRAGVANRLEVHANAWIPLGASIGGKFQLVGNRTRPGLAVSLGLDVGTLQIGAEDSSGNDERLTVIDVYVPLYLGFRTGPGFAAYVSPKYIQRNFVGESGDTASEKMAGATLGVAIGAKTTFLLEGTAIRDLDLDATAFQASAGLAF